MSYRFSREELMSTMENCQTEEDQFFINPHAIKPPTEERAVAIRGVIDNLGKARHQFADGKTWVQFLVDGIEAVEPNNHFWPKNIAIRLANVRALQHLNYISENEMNQYIRA